MFKLICIMISFKRSFVEDISNQVMQMRFPSKDHKMPERSGRFFEDKFTVKFTTVFLEKG